MTDAPPRRRDAAKTRQLLLEAARRRFAEDGYAATTVREIADDAGVNVALISRYFASKEGLFEACLKGAGEDLRRTTGEIGRDQIAATMASHIADSSSSGAIAGQLALLLRSSGDERADQIRLEVLRTSTERLAAVAGGDDALLGAQIVFATAIGISLLRSSIRMEPIASATEAQLEAHLRNLVDALLPPPGMR
ncbi:TetR/AcrR family transcriptional regulator [Actinoplanes sp. CA-142083]|uniref:TetR/AcrR family transcriptional regulator n=1 Tax=Actinoplanes sp. CA-142083 TaxID=3239903 RepID=UPI003D93A3D0